MQLKSLFVKGLFYMKDLFICFFEKKSVACHRSKIFGEYPIISVAVGICNLLFRIQLTDCFPNLILLFS